ncbi:MAG: response regulator [Bdellovibrio sp.]|nr:response regulator [Bdellovibrio sp.]
MSEYRVLVVDDEPLVRESILDSLPLGYSGIEAVDGLDALEKMQLLRPDVILTDYNMPRMDGSEFIRCLYENHVDIPVVMLTGRGTRSLHVDTWVRGVFEYLEKPFEPEALSRILNSALRSKVSLQAESEFRNLTAAAGAHLNITLDKKLCEKIKLLATSEGLSVSSYIERTLREKLEKG